MKIYRPIRERDLCNVNRIKLDKERVRSLTLVVCLCVTL